MTETIEQRLTRVFQDVFDDDELQIRPEMTADDVDGWDSITHIVLIAAVEREFKVDFTTAEVTGLKNVGDLIALIGKKTAK